MHCDDEGRWIGLRVSLFSLSFASICKKVFEQHPVNILDMVVIHVYVLSLISGSDIVQWMIKNLDIEDHVLQIGEQGVISVLHLLLNYLQGFLHIEILI